MRKSIIIDRSQSGCLWKSVIKRANHLDTVEQVNIITTNKTHISGLVGLSGVIKTIITDVLADCSATDRELRLAPDHQEQEARNYLQAILKRD